MMVDPVVVPLLLLCATARGTPIRARSAIEMIVLSRLADLGARIKAGWPVPN